MYSSPGRHANVWAAHTRCFMQELFTAPHLAACLRPTPVITYTYSTYILYLITVVQFPLRYKAHPHSSLVIFTTLQKLREQYLQFTYSMLMIYMLYSLDYIIQHITLYRYNIFWLLSYKYNHNLNLTSFVMLPFI